MKFKSNRKVLLVIPVLAVCTAVIISLANSRQITEKKLLEAAAAPDSQPVYITQDSLQDEQISIKPGEILERRPYAVNSGETACYVRVQLVLPTSGDTAIFRVGNLENGNFSETFSSPSFVGEGSATKKEYWQRIGDYLYYRNSETSDKLTCGSASTEIYQAVRLNSAINQEDLSQVNNFDIVIYAESVSAENASSLEKAFELD